MIRILTPINTYDTSYVYALPMDTLITAEMIIDKKYDNNIRAPMVIQGFRVMYTDSTTKNPTNAWDVLHDQQLVTWRRSFIMLFGSKQ